MFKISTYKPGVHFIVTTFTIRFQLTSLVSILSLQPLRSDFNLQAWCPFYRYDPFTITVIVQEQSVDAIFKSRVYAIVPIARKTSKIFFFARNQTNCSAPWEIQPSFRWLKSDGPASPKNHSVFTLNSTSQSTKLYQWKTKIFEQITRKRVNLKIYCRNFLIPKNAVATSFQKS